MVQDFGSEGPPEVHGNLAWLKPTIAFSLEIGPMKKLLEQGYNNAGKGYNIFRVRKTSSLLQSTAYKESPTEKIGIEECMHKMNIPLIAIPHVMPALLWLCSSKSLLDLVLIDHC
ncbi:hypothetical protein VNO80_22001 [Phaseolus coccineus]|uniref:Uncharacterized protein n=1 Tax=Phaseolus coccineus TaxID=3886 RepID=A0AAN9M4W3_PHACN